MKRVLFIALVALTVVSCGSAGTENSSKMDSAAAPNSVGNSAESNGKHDTIDNPGRGLKDTSGPNNAIRQNGGAGNQDQPAQGKGGDTKSGGKSGQPAGTTDTSTKKQR